MSSLKKARLGLASITKVGMICVGLIPHRGLLTILIQNNIEIAGLWIQSKREWLRGQSGLTLSSSEIVWRGGVWHHSAITMQSAT
jgi:hypothetical protein